MSHDFIEYSELYHYGILGMHWGIRRFQNENGSLTGAGRKRYNVGNKRDSSNDKVLDKQSVINVGNSVILNYTENKVLDIYFKTDAETAVKSKEYDLYTKTSTNCPNCALAVELKKRGMNVKPKANGGLSANQVHELYAGEKTFTCKRTQDFYKAKNYGKPGDHGQMFGYYSSGSGHILNYTVLADGTVQFEDAQSGQLWPTLTRARIDDECSVNYFVSGEIINLTKAEIDMDYAKKMDMVDTSNYANDTDKKIQQYEQKVKNYVKTIKSLDMFKSILKNGAIKTLANELLKYVRI